MVRVARIAEPKISREDGKKVHPKLSGTMLSDTEPNARVQGVRVEKIHTASYAYRAGLRPGDVIVMANRERVGNLRELKAVVSGSAELLLNVQRENGSFFLLLR